MKNNLVSVIIPVKNSGAVLENCLKHLKNQTYHHLEILVVDSFSTDNTSKLCKSYNSKLIQFNNQFLKNRFDATYKRNLGAKNAQGDFVYYLDADFELTPKVIEEAVNACTKNGYDAVIVKEIVKGEGFWTKCKWLEQETYWGDDNVEAPRFFKKEVWVKLGGLDENLGAGCDDWDLYQRFLTKGYKAVRIKAPLYHNERKITLWGSAKKAFLYGKDTSKFVKKNFRGSFLYFFPIRPAYLRHWKLFLKHPFLGLGLVFLRSGEYLAGAAGILTSRL